MTRKGCLLLLLLCSLLSLPAFAQPSSDSKLSAHLINSYTVGSSNIVSGRPRVLKVLALDSGFPSGMAQAMRDYKGKVSAGKVVVRVYSPKNYSLADDATASATDFWNAIIQPALDSLSSSDRALIDYLEGPNEGQTPTLGYPASAPLQASQWFNQFWTNLTPRITAAGYKPCIGSIAVGNPGGTPAQMQTHLATFVPALRQAQAAGGAWSYHAYTINYTTEIGTEIYYSLRYRQFYSYFASAFPDLNSMPLILTEGGVDFSGDPNTSGWQVRGSAGDFARWLNWFDQQLRQDSYVVGCTLFENGDPAGWSSFELEPIANWMRGYLAGPSALPPAPTGVAARPGLGSVVLSWTNTPITPTTWTVRRSTNSGGPYFGLAAGINNGVQATSYIDTAVVTGLNYYYVVTAVNAVGEGPASSEVSAGLAPPSAVNCGGPTSGSFQADTFFDTGTSYSTSSAIDLSGVANPAPMAVYQSQRYGTVTYTFPYLKPNTSYRLRLHFAEIYWAGVGQRVFNVLVNGVQVLTNFDIVRAAGAAFKANIQDLNAITDANGQVAVRLAPVTDNASINGIEILASPATAAPLAPTNLVATVGNALVTLAWAVPAEATNFLVKRATLNGGPYSIIASNLTQATYRDPSFVPNTTYYYVVSASNALGESPDSSQVAARPTNSLPDVVVTSATWTPTALFTGSRVVFSARVLNRGSTATPQGVQLGVGFNVDGAGTASWSSAYTAALAPNSSVNLNADGGPSGVNYWVATPGKHTVVANVDDVNRFAESIEDNNTLAATFNVFATSYALNSGGPAVGTFAADANFAGSANTFAVTNSIDLSGAANPAPGLVYQSERWGEFAYVLNNLVPGSNYTVRLHFAEISPAVNGAGDRRFNVSVNSVQVLTDFDLFAITGGKFKALSRDVKMRADASGNLIVQFIRGSANEPKCSGIQLFGSSPPSQAVTISGLAVTNGMVTLTWPASPGGVYQVAYKDDLGQQTWQPSANPSIATGASLFFTTPSTNRQKFYRVALIN